MKIVVAPDSFKDSLSSIEVCQHIYKGLYKQNSTMEIILVPVADGGEGTREILTRSLNGKNIEIEVHDPLMRPLRSYFGWLETEKTAIIETADSSGITLLDKWERNPLNTTTYGVGETITAALEYGASKILIGLGGSSTNDGGVGMASALGVKFITSNNKFVIAGGYLKEIVKIDITHLNQKLYETGITVLSDVVNPFIGENGASKMYASQKGASAEEVLILEENMQYLAYRIKKDIKKDISKINRAGAAGGLGGALSVFCNAKLTDGFTCISNILKLEGIIKKCDLVITGEGRIDNTTLNNKATMGVALLAKKHNKPVIAISGDKLGGEYKNFNKLFDEIVCLKEDTMTLEDTVKNAPFLLERASINISDVILKKYI